ncbi:hypothetical protein SAMN05444920_1258 [Nonomuraea solani]|uniref:Uncharacterized protein n=1 Tax=Nonomuraea solani TaxID=1144553 RepID=A0A1H6EYQ4_9ACTN|nr:hypothetical protein SAMN05444920_1258 [Nonomuraea solani]
MGGRPLTPALSIEVGAGSEAMKRYGKVIYRLASIRP